MRKISKALSFGFRATDYKIFAILFIPFWSYTDCWNQTSPPGPKLKYSATKQMNWLENELSHCIKLILIMQFEYGHSQPLFLLCLCLCAWSIMGNWANAVLQKLILFSSTSLKGPTAASLEDHSVSLHLNGSHSLSVPLPPPPSSSAPATAELLCTDFLLCVSVERGVGGICMLAIQRAGGEPGSPSGEPSQACRAYFLLLRC